MKETISNIYEEEVKTPMVGYFWKGFALFLLGVVIGFLLAPIKKGVKMGCNNGNNNGNNCSASGNTVSASEDEENAENAEDENAEDEEAK